jgi:ribosome-binding protein aMBF1 (putative translation factor)
MTDSEHAHSVFLRAFAQAIDERRRERGLSPTDLDAVAHAGETDPATLRALGAAVRDFRTRAGLSVSELAARLSLPAEHVEALEAGLVHPRLATVVAFASALGVPLSDLARRADELEGSSG